MPWHLSRLHIIIQQTINESASAEPTTIQLPGSVRPSSISAEGEPAAQTRAARSTSLAHILHLIFKLICETVDKSLIDLDSDPVLDDVAELVPLFGGQRIHGCGGIS
jgi:hypothetical protein